MIHPLFPWDKTKQYEWVATHLIELDEKCPNSLFATMVQNQKVTKLAGAQQGMRNGIAPRTHPRFGFL